MFKRILVPLDGSLLAEAALAPATVLAERFGAGLLLVRTIRVHVFAGADPGPAQLDALREAEAYLEQVSQRVRAPGVAVETAIPYDTPPAGITDQAEFRHVDLIVMSTHGRKWVDALLHPSVTMQVLEHTSAPILAWKHTETTAETPQLPRFMTDPAAPIVVPLDGSLLAESALPIAEGLSQRFGNPLFLISVAEPPRIPIGPYDYPAMIADVDQAAVAENQQYLHRKQQEIAGRGQRVETESAIGSPAASIEDYIQKMKAGLVIIASHGRGGLGRWLLGSVAQQLLRDTETPVLLVRFHPTATESGK
ncbi:MAG TPA: universal stress protein [Ktedonobacterales bacterium]|nr:universal stress protein [Ktedonobacterales bacterium]